MDIFLMGNDIINKWTLYTDHKNLNKLNFSLCLFKFSPIKFFSLNIQIKLSKHIFAVQDSKIILNNKYPKKDFKS